MTDDRDEAASDRRAAADDESAVEHVGGDDDERSGRTRRVARRATRALPAVASVAAEGALRAWQSLSEAQGRGRGDRELAILFTDLEGFSSWSLSAGDTLAVELVRRVTDAAEPEIRARGGRVVKRLGDGLMATFLDAPDAVAAAVAARDAVAAVSVGGHSPRQRAGVHLGRPRRIGGDYLGVDVNVAARIADAAKPGEVLVSDVVAERLGESAALKRRWRTAGKGTPAGMKVFSVEGFADGVAGSSTG